jgi:hypothetical protein
VTHDDIRRVLEAVVDAPVAFIQNIRDAVDHIMVHRPVLKWLVVGADVMDYLENQKWFMRNITVEQKEAWLLTGKPMVFFGVEVLSDRLMPERLIPIGTVAMVSAPSGEPEVLKRLQVVRE